VHIGCPGPDEALWLLHAMSRFVPHVIAMSASSPYVQGTDTGFHSARLNSVFAFPLSGRAPFVLHWDGFKVFFDKMRRTGVVASMKDFYWDIRPKPEYGTIEVRVMDTPLTIERAAAIAAYLQCVARWLVRERPIEPHEDDYLAYTYNRFQACRFGLDGEVVDPRTAEHRPLRALIRDTLAAVEMHAIELHAERGLAELRALLDDPLGSDADWLRAQQQDEQFLPEVVRRQCLRFEGG
jgi:carboxylate-amine ligase